MKKHIKIIHAVISISAWGVFIFSLIRLLTVYHSLDEEIGIHFGSSGEFDVIASKKFIAYPYIISLVSLGLCELFTSLSQKINTGFKITQTADQKIKEAVVIFLDISKFCFSFFFAGIWADCVMQQHVLNPLIPNMILTLLFIAFILLILFLIAVKIRNPDKIPN